MPDGSLRLQPPPTPIPSPFLLPTHSVLPGRSAEAPSAREHDSSSAQSMPLADSPPAASPVANPEPAAAQPAAQQPRTPYARVEFPCSPASESRIRDVMSIISRLTKHGNKRLYKLLLAGYRVRKPTDVQDFLNLVPRLGDGFRILEDQILELVYVLGNVLLDCYTDLRTAEKDVCSLERRVHGRRPKQGPRRVAGGG